MIRFAIKGATLAAAITLGLTATQAENLPEDQVAVFLTIKTQPGQRDDLVTLWDTHLKARAAQNTDHVSYVFALDMMDPERVHITEVYATQAAFEANTQAQWFAAYMAEASQFLAEEPEFAMARPHWMK